MNAEEDTKLRNPSGIQFSPARMVNKLGLTPKELLLGALLALGQKISIC